MKDLTKQQPGGAAPYAANLGKYLIVYVVILILAGLQFGDASASLVLRDTYTTNGSLSLSHASIDINISCSNEKWAIFWSVEPAVALPH